MRETRTKWKRKKPNKYDGMTYSELLEKQPELITVSDIRQFHKALCKLQKSLGVPFWLRGMPLMSRYPDFPEQIMTMTAYFILLILVIELGMLISMLVVGIVR